MCVVTSELIRKIIHEELEKGGTKEEWMERVQKRLSSLFLENLEVDEDGNPDSL